MIYWERRKKLHPIRYWFKEKLLMMKRLLLIDLLSFFSSIGQILQAEGLMNSNDDFLDYEFVDDRGTGSEIKFQPCTEDEILKVVKIAKSNSAGSDGPIHKTFKSAICYLLPCLVYIINFSLLTGEFPDALKRAKIIPCAKGILENYRSISILPLFSKLCIKRFMITLKRRGQ